MRIRTQFVLSTAVFGGILLVIAVSLAITNQRIDWTNRQEQTARNLERDANELSYLSGAYLLHQESQQLSRWESRLASFSSNLLGLNPDTPEQRVIADNLKTNLQRLKAVFTEIGTSLETPGKALDPAYVQVSWSRMEVQNQGMIFDASRLAQIERDQADELKRWNTIVMFTLISLLGIFLLVNYVLTYRRILRSILALQAGTLVIGSGDLDFAIPVKRNDEIGDLTRAFNQMTTDLKGVTASKADLEREITEREKAEEERERLHAGMERRAAELSAVNKELETFAYSVSHDLRAPQRRIDGFTRALEEDYAERLDEQGRRFLSLVREETERMGQLIDGMLVLSRVARSELHLHHIDLSALAQEIAEELCTTQPERKVEFAVASGLKITGDGTLLRVVLQNLLGNAWKFTARHPAAKIELGTVDQEGGRVYFVRDDGAGFDMAYADKLFTPFQRLHKEDEFPGTGIGLATVQRIIHRHGGKVWAEGEVDKGATFYFTLG